MPAKKKATTKKITKKKIVKSKAVKKTPKKKKTVAKKLAKVTKKTTRNFKNMTTKKTTTPDLTLNQARILMALASSKSRKAVDRQVLRGRTGMKTGFSNFHMCGGQLWIVNRCSRRHGDS